MDIHKCLLGPGMYQALESNAFGYELNSTFELFSLFLYTIFLQTHFFIQFFQNCSRPQSIMYEMKLILC